VIPSKQDMGTQGYIVKRGTLDKYMALLSKSTWLAMTTAVQAAYPSIPQARECDILFCNMFKQTLVYPPLVIEQRNNISLLNDSATKNETLWWEPFFKDHESDRDYYWALPRSPNSNEVCFAILAKNKAETLPFFLECLLRQTYPKSNIHLYIRTNDNTDETAALLQAFVKEHGSKYASVFYDDSSVNAIVKEFKNHEWNATRFKLLGKLRQDSVEYAKKKGAHYFVADCDNFIVPNTLERMLEQQALGVVAPMLVTKTAYSNYHYDIDTNGYLKDHPNYLKILNRVIMGCVEVKVVHCTYFVAHHQLANVCYDDKSARYEYVIFSDELRKRGVPQYLDNRQYYGFLTFADTKDQFETDTNYHKDALAKYFSTTPITKKVIPNIIHQIWVGPKPIPTTSIEFITNIRRLHPDYEYRLWSDKDITPETFKNYSYIMNCKSYAQKADLMRYEILYNHGGIYLDIDFELFQNLTPLLTNDLVVCNEDESIHEKISNSFFACIKHNPQLLNCVNSVKNINFLRSIQIASGPVFFRQCLDLKNNVTLLPTHMMFPTHYTNPTKPFVKTDNTYGCHHWNKMW
jgi:mannosyltransferase OCH1-like enzyme